MMSLKEKQYNRLQKVASNKGLKHPVVTPMNLVDEILDKLDLDNIPNINILYSLEFAVSLVEDYGYDSSQITLFTDGDPLLNMAADAMKINSEDKLDNMKHWSLTLGNPPYNKNAAIEFLNASADTSDEIVFVLPKTFKKKSVLNRIRDDLHLETHVDNPDDTFGKTSGLRTCVQTWKVDKSKKRTPIRVYKKGEVSDYFIFTTMEESDLAVGKVGTGAAGRVFTAEDCGPREKNYEDKSPASHHFIKVKNKGVIKQLKELQPILKEMAHDTVSNPSLSIDDLVRTYIEHYVEGDLR